MLKIVDFSGLEDFKGAMFHSGEQDDNVEFEEKTIAGIGSATSVVQYRPEVAKAAGELTVFQRRANWIKPRNQHVFTNEEADNFSKLLRDFPEKPPSTAQNAQEWLSTNPI